MMETYEIVSRMRLDTVTQIHFNETVQLQQSSHSVRKDYLEISHHDSIIPRSSSFILQ